ncbi:Ig-like domain-containing protein [Rhodococcus triatomae]
MSRNVIRRSVAAVGVAALAVLGFGLGAGTASAATSATKNTDNIKVTKSVSPGTVVRGATVTYKTVFEVTSIVDRYITKITDVHPAGFEYVPGSAKVTSSELLSGPSTETPVATVDAAGSRLTVGGNWLVSDRPLSSNKDVIFEVTYRVPDTAAPGTVDSGLTFDVATFQSTQTFVPMGVHVQVNAPATATTTALTAPTLASVGTAVTLRATVTPAPSGGSVQFHDNGVPVGAPVPVVSGGASLSHVFDTAGSHSVSAVYSGGGDYRESTSQVVGIQVSDPADGGGSLDVSTLFAS